MPMFVLPLIINADMISYSHLDILCLYKDICPTLKHFFHHLLIFLTALLIFLLESLAGAALKNQRYFKLKDFNIKKAITNYFIITFKGYANKSYSDLECMPRSNSFTHFTGRASCPISTCKCLGLLVYDKKMILDLNYFNPM